jgi:hypothetical protein
MSTRQAWLLTPGGRAPKLGSLRVGPDAGRAAFPLFERANLQGTLVHPMHQFDVSSGVRPHPGIRQLRTSERDLDRLTDKAPRSAFCAFAPEP